jgi:SAM-dependent methyltransferase
MTQAPMMTDIATLARHRARAQPSAMFLHEAAADEVEDRMRLVKKSFNSVALVTGFTDFWRMRLPQAHAIADSDTLTLAPAAYDLIVHAMGLHWANDPVGQLIQCRHAMKPDGLLLTVSFGGQTLNELRACLGEAEVRITGGLSPRIAPMADLRDMGALLQRAGFALPVADTIKLNVEYRDIWCLMRELRLMGEGNALEQRLRKPTRRAVFEAAAKLYQENFSGDQGRITATFELLFLAGWAPDESQPKPLRPGSAQQRLADALGTDETKLPN